MCKIFRKMFYFVLKKDLVDLGLLVMFAVKHHKKARLWHIQATYQDIRLRTLM